MLDRRFAALLLLMLFVLGYAGPTQAQAGQPCFFAQTGHTLADPLLSYWNAHGGLPVFGYPRSEAFYERRIDMDMAAWTQYFERNRLEAHPENQAPYDVLLGRLGVEALEKQGRNWQSFPKAAPSAPRFFAPTGHAIAHAPFWAYWSGRGLEFDGRPGTSAAESLALWGYPISEPALETNASGDRVLTQWFERARFEDHGAKGVLLGLLGNELVVERGKEPAFGKVAGPAAVRRDLAGKIAFARAGDTWLYRPRTGELRKLLDGTTDFRWSSDGRMIAYTRADGLYVAAADGTDQRQVHAAADLHLPIWAPDGSRLAFVRGAVQQTPDGERDEREVWVVELQSRQARKIAAGSDPAWAPDSKRLAYVTVARGAGVIESVGGYNPGRNELHVVTLPGMAGRVVVRDMPATVRQQFAREQVELGHALREPFWDSAGASIYVVAAIVSVPDATLYALERADAAKGGTSFVSELANISEVTPAPNGRAILADMSGLGSAPWFEARATTGDQAAWRWAATKGDPLELRWHSRPAWAPDSRAVAYPLCEPRYGSQSSSTFCTLILLTPRGSAALVPSTSMERVDWGRDE